MKPSSKAPKGRGVKQHPPMDLIGAKAAAALIGVQVSNLKPYDDTVRPPKGIRGLPDPVASGAPGRVWYAPDVEAFAKEYRATRKRG